MADLNTGITGQEMKDAVLRAHNLKSITYTGLVVSVPDTQVKGFFASAQTLSLLPNATWYVGLDQFSKELIALPRLGHTGWIPVAKCVCDATTITELTPIDPVLPVCRLPRTVEKLVANKSLNVLIMGSSLAQSMLSEAWTQLVFGATDNDYKLSDNITITNHALGGSPNQYELAQTGIGSSCTALNFNNQGYPLTVTPKKSQNGRAGIYENIDLAVITVLANYGDYRLQCIEPIIRNLRKRGIEVIVVSDNARNTSGNDFDDIDAMSNAELYVDGEYVKCIADKYSVEFADTAAYVAEATFRYPLVSIYGDIIHMSQAPINGATGQPASGNEVWARAIRSVIPVYNMSQQANQNQTFSYDFNNGLVPTEWTGFSEGILSNASNQLKVDHPDGDHAAGAWVSVPAGLTGDSYTISGILGEFLGISAVKVGGQGGGAGWSSDQHTLASGSFSVSVTLQRDVPDGHILFYVASASPDGSYFTLDDVVVTHIPVSSSGINNKAVHGVNYKSGFMPPSRVVDDYKTPGDAFVILPVDERYYAASHADAGFLTTHPGGAVAFSARFNSSIPSTEHVLQLDTGKKASISGAGVVSFSMVYWPDDTVTTTVDVYSDNVFIKTLTIAPSTINREFYAEIMTPTQKNKGDSVPSIDVIELRVTAGSIKICALICLTFDQDYIAPEGIEYVGSWSSKISGGGANMPGYSTDTQGDYAVLKNNGNKVSWLISSRPDSKTINTWSGSSEALNTATNGANEIVCVGNHTGNGQYHYIECNETLTPAGSATNGYGLHIGGAIIVNDR